jgi:hypothetical protein
MDLHKKLISFYKMSKELETSRLKLKELKKTAAKLNRTKEITLSEIQDVIDHHIKIKSFLDAVDRLPGKLLGIQRKTITVLMDVGLPGKTVVQ